MKRITAILACLLVLVSCVALAGCGKQDLTNSKYLGTWVADKTRIMNDEANADDVFEGGWTIKLNPDGTAVVTSKEQISNCTWSETSKGVKFKGDMKVKAVAEGEDLVIKMLGMRIYFVKLSDTAEAVSEVGGAISDAVSGLIDSAVSGAADIVNSVTDGN